MGFFDALFGRQKPVPMGPERLFAISTAETTLEADQGLRPSGGAAMCFKGLASGPFAQLQRNLDELLTVADRQDHTFTYRHYTDEMNYQWLIFESKDFQALVTNIHVASRQLIDEGYSTQLLFAIFGFINADGHTLYWMYNYKRGTFYPFVPKTDTHDKTRPRDNAEELRLANVMKSELPVEDEVERWYPVWDLPF